MMGGQVRLTFCTCSVRAGPSLSCFVPNPRSTEKIINAVCMMVQIYVTSKLMHLLWLTQTENAHRRYRICCIVVTEE